MLVGVKFAMSVWLIILKSKIKLENNFIYKICSKESHFIYLFHNLSSHMKDWQDNNAVQFRSEITSE
jgi:hypothetical protein